MWCTELRKPTGGDSMRTTQLWCTPSGRIQVFAAVLASCASLTSGQEVTVTPPSSPTTASSTEGARAEDPRELLAQLIQKLNDASLLKDGIALTLEAKRANLDGTPVLERGRWIHCGGTFVLEQASVDFELDAQVVAPYMVFQMVGRTDGSGLLRGANRLTLAVAQLSPIYDFDAVGMLDGSNLFMLRALGKSWEYYFRDVDSIQRESVGESADVFRLSFDPQAKSRKEVEIWLENREGRWIVNRSVMTIHPDVEHWREDGGWSSESRTITAWNADVPMQVTTRVERAGKQGEPISVYERTLTVTARADNVTDPTRCDQLRSKSALIPGERVEVSARAIVFQVGSAIFKFGRHEYQAPQVLNEIPTDMKALVEVSRRLPSFEPSSPIEDSGE